MHFLDTNAVILKNQKYLLKCVCIYRKNNPNGEFWAIFYKSLNLCSTDQLTVEIIRNCNTPLFAENWYLQEMYFDILLNMYSLDVICLLPHEVVVYDIKIFATSYFFNK